MKTNILVVDDEREFADMLAERLERKGFSTAVVYDGFEALSWLNGNSCEIVLLDLSMPGINGIDVLPQIKKVHPLVQIVILTASSDVNIAITGMKLGATDFLIKPVAFHALLAGIREAQARKTSHEESLRMIEISKMASFGVLAEGVAHEIMNPVNVMLTTAGWVEDLLKDNLAEDRPEIFDSLVKLREHGMRCKDIVAKLLAFGGRIDPTPKPVQINDSFATLIKKIRSRAEELQVDIQGDFSPDLPMISLPPAEFMVALENIIDNSLDAMEENGGVLRITTSLADNCCHFKVSDSGTGIAKENLGRIFEPFFSTKDVGKGTGLGLSICYRVVKGLSGEIKVESKEGEGTTLFVRLPIPPDN
ncbi:MAG: response regulator [Proteobacteria bacterium]|nr:response regulator [Pseudomonadota bacterium]MBU1058254.1 response regulator [Pseudomonadota bacterium]